MQWARLGTPVQVARHGRAYFATLLTPGQVPPGVIVASHEGEPATFGGALPAQVTTHYRGRGVHPRVRGMVKEMYFYVRFYAIALRGPQGQAQGQAVNTMAEAEDVVMAAYDAWFSALSADAKVWREVEDLNVDSYEVSPRARTGEVFMDRQNTLMRLQADVRVTL